MNHNSRNGRDDNDHRSGSREPPGGAYDHGLTHMEIVCLEALCRYGSQRAAARKIGIGAPAVHRHIDSACARTGLGLVNSHGNSTSLTPVGRTLLGMVQHSGVGEGGGCLASGIDPTPGQEEDISTIRIGVTEVSMDRTRSAISSLEHSSRYIEMVVAHDDINMEMLTGGILDGILLDDPSILTAVVGTLFDDLTENAMPVFRDELVHIDRGPEHLLTGMGAERMGYRYLESRGRRADIRGREYDPASLFRSRKSFFMNRSVFERLVASGAPYNAATGDVEELPEGLLGFCVIATFSGSRSLRTALSMERGSGTEKLFDTIRTEHLKRMHLLVGRMSETRDDMDRCG